MTDFKNWHDYSAGTVVALPNHEFSDVAFYTNPNGPEVVGRIEWHLAPVVALPYIALQDGRQVVDPTWMANPGLSTVVPVADLDNQGRT